MNYFEAPYEEVLKSVKSSESGLSKQEAERRLASDGPNEISEGKKKTVLQVFLSQFADVLVAILIVCSILSLLTGNIESTIVILLVITMNSVIGTVEHFKAEKSLSALKAMSAPHARVIRDGSVCDIPAREVVVGDILVLEAGSVASADGRVIEAAGLLANESSLTGESDSVLKTVDPIKANGKEVVLGDRLNMIYSGSLITGGRGVIVVTGTGMNTEIGNIAEMISNAEAKKTPLQRSLDSFSKKLSIAIMVICVIVLGLSLLRGQNILDAMMFAVALAVAAIPEALSSIVTISLAIGTQKMAKHNAVIRDLKAVEGLGCVSVICSDKTGTLTQNKMTVREFYADGKHSYASVNDSNSLLLPMILCNDAAFTEGNSTLGDPTETALIEYFGKDKTETVREQYPRLGEIPFDSDRKLMSTVHSVDGENVMLTKGAVDVMLKRLTKIEDGGVLRDIGEDDIKKIIEMNVEFSEKGMRVLCFGKKTVSDPAGIDVDDETGYIFMGLCAMTDPPRPESKPAVEDCKRAGIKPVMITGDHKMTAIAIAREVGIFNDGDLALDGAELEMLSDEELSKMLPKVSVYARVSPAHKIRIVTLWQELGHIVAMTGDGVNDAPALKKADVGVAMGITGTEVSKDAASMILTDDNFATIIKSVARGRSIYANIKNSIMFLLTGNLAAIIAVLYNVIMGLAAPFSAVQLLFINLLTDSLPAIAISMEPADKNLLNEKPRGINDSILDKQMMSTTGVIGVLISIFTIIAYYIGHDFGGDVAASTMAFGTLCLGRLFHCFNCRGRNPINILKFSTNPFSIAAFFAGVLFLAAALLITPIHDLFTVTTLSPALLGYLVLLAAAPTVIIQIYKNIAYFTRNKA
ncbi:MAG TPA: cation-translocating P-type ATPase [Candidatus Monoglobus merdigallinarum]|uniref:Cation-translocating P-type ATPase n=1 Tax=Candidatus Monoglobus merdigallinarum TaxID=2838698 RepID=A0A9D1PRT7_9FIRM|nr:cation-translocating P-type ATPase [Candidatus Monoglobus merdigallinarum]